MNKWKVSFYLSATDEKDALAKANVDSFFYDVRELTEKDLQVADELMKLNSQDQV